MRSFSLLGLLLLAPGISGLAVAEVNETSRPLIARPATTTSSFNMDIYASYVDGQALQEADDFKGWTAGFDFTLPINQTMQLRMLLPLRTEGEAELRANAAQIDIEGWGGVFDFATLFFEHQLVGRDGGANRFAYFLGAGYRTGVLETGTPDKYNHQGRSLHAGARYERHWSGFGVLLLDAEYRSYEISDDLNPANANDDRFNLFRLRQPARDNPTVFADPSEPGKRTRGQRGVWKWLTETLSDDQAAAIQAVKTAFRAGAELSSCIW